MSPGVRNLRRRIQELRRRKANVRAKELNSLAEASGRRLSTRGKEPMFIKEGRPPLAIPNHPRAMSPVTVQRILNMLEEDLDYQEGGVAE